MAVKIKVDGPEMRYIVEIKGVAYGVFVRTGSRKCVFHPYRDTGFGAEALQAIAKWMAEYDSGSL